MRLISLVLFLLMSSYFGVAQNDSIPKSLTLEFPQYFKKAEFITEISIPLRSTKDSIITKTVDLKSSNWDTTVYNPFKNEPITYPIAITFEDSTYASPVKHFKVITSRFGWRRGRPHKGIDIDLVTGDSVVSMFSGIVRFARYSRGHGRTVVVRHYNGLETTYAHLSQIAVKVNDTVTKGQLIGKGGNTGNSRGSHLHLETRYKGVHIHPEYLFHFDDTNKIRSKELWITRKWTRASSHNSRRLSKLDLHQTKEEALASLEKIRKIYVVRKGDTLSRISQINNTTITAICKTNKIKRNATLRIGQELILEL